MNYTVYKLEIDICPLYTERAVIILLQNAFSMYSHFLIAIRGQFPRIQNLPPYSPSGTSPLIPSIVRTQNTVRPTSPNSQPPSPKRTNLCPIIPTSTALDHCPLAWNSWIQCSS